MDEILLYGLIYSESAKDFIHEMNEAESDITVRINSQGGDVKYGWGMVTKFKEYVAGKKRIIVDGGADSMAFNFLLYADKGEVEAVDVATFVFHRAAYYSVEFEQNYLSTSDIEHLKMVNKSLETAFRNRVDVTKFEELKGVTVNEVFSMDTRIDVNLTAKELKAIGLVDRIITITPQKQAEITANYNRIIAQSGFLPKDYLKETPKANNQANPKTQIKMTEEVLRAEHPALYSAVIAKGVEQGVTAERDRVGAWAAFNEIDPVKVKEGIESGLPLTAKATAEFSVAAFKVSATATLEAEGKSDKGADAASGAGSQETEQEKTARIFAEKLNASVGLTAKK